MAELFYIMISFLLATIAANVSTGTGNNVQLPLRYNVTEQLPVGTLIGDVRADYVAAVTSPEVRPTPSTSSVRYTLRHASNFFQLDVDGKLRTSRVLDREEICSQRPAACELNVDAVLRGPQLVAIIKIVVTVDDVNDHAPQFPAAQLPIGVAINVPADATVGALFPLPVADDADTGRLGVVGYRLDGAFPADLFSLRVADLLDGSHDVRLKLDGRLDRRPESVYSMKLTAFDGGSPSKMASIPLTINVERSTPPALPRFDPTVYTARIAENAAIKTPITHVRARLMAQPEMDSRAGSRQIIYGFDETDGSLPFGIDSQTGLVYVRDVIDYERNRTFRLTVTASASGSSRGSSARSNSATAQLVIDVLDANDNAPEMTVNALTKSGRPEVRESAPEGTFVAHVAVHDVDGPGDNSRTSCTVVGSADFKLHQLVSGSRPEYKLTTSGATGATFDRETVDSYHVTVECRDYGTPSMTSSVVVPVDVVDENDNAPRFSNNSYLLTVSAGSWRPNMELFQVAASDADAGQNAALRFHLEPVDPSYDRFIKIDQLLGVISTTAHHYDESDTEYRYVITATDCGENPRSSTAELIVRVVPHEVLEPVPTVTFDQPNYLFVVDCDEPVDSFVGRVTASSTSHRLVPLPSSSPSSMAAVTYSFQPRSALFRIDPRSGEIFVSVALDSEELEKSVAADDEISLTVLATRAGNIDELAASTTLIVHIRCDFPRFLFPNQLNNTVQIIPSSESDKEDDEDSSVVVVLPSVRSRPGSTLRFSIVDGNVGGTFSIDPSSGLVRLARRSSSSDSTSGRAYRLTLSVSDETGSTSVVELNVRVVTSPSAEVKFVDAEVPATATALSGLLLSTDRAVVMVGMVCGAVGLLLAILVAVVVTVLLKRRRVKRTSNYNCRIEEANKSRMTPSSSEDVFECSSLRQSKDRRDVTDGGSSDRSLESMADDDDGVIGVTSIGNSPVNHETLQTRRIADSRQTSTTGVLPGCTGKLQPLPPPILKTSVKKEVKFCLDVRDDEGLKRPLNVYHQETVPDDIIYRCPVLVTPSLRAAGPAEDGDCDSLGSGGSVTDSGRGASEEGDSSGPAGVAAAGTLAAAGQQQQLQHGGVATITASLQPPPLATMRLQSTPDVCNTARMTYAVLLTSPCRDDVTSGCSDGVIKFPPLCHSSPIDQSGTTSLVAGRRHQPNCDLLPVPVLSTFRREQPAEHVTCAGRDVNRNRLQQVPVRAGQVGGASSPRDLDRQLVTSLPTRTTNNCVLCTALNDCGMTSNGGHVGHVMRTERIADV